MTDNIIEKIKENISYDPVSGRFFWITTARSGTRIAGRETGYSKSGKGYRVIKLNGKRLLAHRVAFVIMTGSFPGIVDHIDRNPSNNRWENLREVTSSENSLNRSLDKRNKTGITGIYYNRKEKVYTVTFKNEYLGRSKDFFEAVCLRKSKENEINEK